MIHAPVVLLACDPTNILFSRYPSPTGKRREVDAGASISSSPEVMIQPILYRDCGLLGWFRHEFIEFLVSSPSRQSTRGVEKRKNRHGVVHGSL